MDENTARTPHPEQPAEGAPDIDGAGGDSAHDGRPEHNPAHNTAPDGRGADDDSHGGAVQGDSSGPGSTGGAIQGDSSREGSTGGAVQGDADGHTTGGAIQGDADPDRDAPLGGDDTTEEQLDADNPVERDSLRTLDPDDPPA